MGSGKTRVGRLLAARLGWELVDTDTLVEAREGGRIADIFRTRGEEAFRDLEAQALASLAGRRSVVIATGGGAPAQERNRPFFSAPGQRVIHLRASLESVRERTRGDRQRPLLARPDAEVLALFEQRRRVYESLGTGVETDGRDPEAIAAEILGLL